MAAKKTPGSRRAVKKVTPAAEGPPSGSGTKRPAYIVGMGGSGGSWEAFEQFFSRMPARSGVAFVLVPHPDPRHKDRLTDLLIRSTAMSVVEVSGETIVRPDRIYVLAPNQYVRITRGRLQPADSDAPRGALRPTDYFLQHLADDQGRRAVAVILSGTGHDGILGVKAVKEHLGLAMAQDPAHATCTSLPKSAIATGLVDYVGSAQELPARLMAYGAHASSTIRETPPRDWRAGEGLGEVMALLRAQTDHDVSLYKPSMIQRRIDRRM